MNATATNGLAAHAHCERHDTGLWFKLKCGTFGSTTLVHLDHMPAYGSIEQVEPRLSKTKSRVVISVLSGLLLLVAVVGAIRFVKFNESQAVGIGAKQVTSFDSQEHVALEQLSASLDRQLETLNQLESKVASNILTAGSVSAHAAAAPHSHPVAVAAKATPEGKSESFLADIVGIQSPAMESQHSNLVKSFESKKQTLPSSSSYFVLSPVLCILVIALAGLLF